MSKRIVIEINDEQLARIRATFTAPMVWQEDDENSQIQLWFGDGDDINDIVIWDRASYATDTDLPTPPVQEVYKELANVICSIINRCTGLSPELLTTSPTQPPVS